MLIPGLPSGIGLASMLQCPAGIGAAFRDARVGLSGLISSGRVLLPALLASFSARVLRCLGNGHQRRIDDVPAHRETAAFPELVADIGQ